MTNFADLDAMDDDDWDKVIFLHTMIEAPLRFFTVLECQREGQLSLIQGGFAHIQCKS